MVLLALPPTNSVFITSNDWLGLTYRLTLALLVGSVIGWERQGAGKAAGLRTHTLVSLGSALFVLIPLLASSSTSIDSVSRAIQGVATGVGFLGAGEILQKSGREPHKLSIKGLTSAATIWLTAALGIAAGCGFWQLCLLSTMMTLFILRVAKHLERIVFHRDD
ncbi:MAG TPA: MgtC/SapB family protein [Oculatellaceae cyanobacterium]